MSLLPSSLLPVSPAAVVFGVLVTLAAIAVQIGRRLWKRRRMQRDFDAINEGLRAMAERAAAMPPEPPTPAPLDPPALDRIGERLTAYAARVGPDIKVAASQYARDVQARAYTATDTQKAALKADPEYRRLFQQCLVDEGHTPEQAARYERTGLDFESQETVDRDYGGSWRHALA